MKNLLRKLQTQNQKYHKAISDAERELRPFIEFEEFGILYQYSDGFVVFSDSVNTPLSVCLEIIKKKGKLSWDDYYGNRI